MLEQLSIRSGFVQLNRPLHTLAILFSVSTLLFGPSTYAQGSLFSPEQAGLRIEPLSSIDEQFMAAQRADVEALANQLGTQLSGDSARDVATIQRILDRGLVTAEDTLGLQALGVVLGDLMGAELSMDWVVYRDPAGRSRALRYRSSDIYLFPVTMISRRWEAGHQRKVEDIFSTNVEATRAKLPGANWR